MKLRNIIQLPGLHLAFLTAGVLALAAALALAVSPTLAEGSPLHPTFPLLDASGENVLVSGEPVSTMTTCGACHNTEFINEHNAHREVLVGSVKTPAGEAIMIDPVSGRLIALEEAADTVEMNCFLCHSTAPNNAARLDALAAGNSEWANTATLTGTEIVEQTGSGFTYNTAAFDAEGRLLPEFVGIQDPAVENCALCHGFATSNPDTTVELATCGTEQRQTVFTGQIYSPQRISESALNISGKDDLTHTWDVHAERVVGCTDCHYSLNNPAYAADSPDAQPDHLIFDPRRLEPGEYLERPLHEFARSSADVLTESTCSACHEVNRSHAWLPYADRHMEALACETCHVARLEAPARQTIDWTVLTLGGVPASECRGQVDEGTGGPRLITGYEPVLLPRDDGDGTTSLAPYNLLTTFFWAAGEGAEPVRLADIQAAFFEGDGYAPEILAAFDASGDGALDSAELVIDSAGKESAVAGRLAALGLSNPHIEARVDAYPINHSVTHGEAATRDCRACHGEDSELVQSIRLASITPGGVAPTLDGTPADGFGQIVAGEDGALYFRPDAGQAGSGIYIFGHSSVKAVDWIGAILFLGVLGAVTVHGGMRFFAARRREPAKPELKELYLYTVYERLWHWLQTAVILLLVFTGLIIHKPDLFGMFSFAYVVQVHNVLAAILVINAALALFYHLASGEIRQFLPEPHGFFNAAIIQAKFYLRGIFRGAEHPYEKTPERKMNPLQQVTYLGLLNILLPLQIITGALMWGAQRWQALANLLGGLPFLAPAHTLIAWLFASFVVAHVYLTTTGPRPLASIRGMVMGWDEVEAHASK
jgi:thiosulfate reductase cytochrome b subunit